ncbi:hypothetical protein CEP88_09835 [Roseobacter denitrificans]|nr:hypothetical protein CEP88_09835 [Roseobacter denitrificans]
MFQLSVKYIGSVSRLSAIFQMNRADCCASVPTKTDATKSVLEKSHMARTPVGFIVAEGLLSEGQKA